MRGRFNANDSADIGSFNSSVPSDIVVFPFHESCLVVLCRVLSGHDDVTEIDKDILYAALWQLTKGVSRSLCVDYGGIQGMDQTWESIPGEEVWFAGVILGGN
jgi:hypothetical protein